MPKGRGRGKLRSFKRCLDWRGAAVWTEEDDEEIEYGKWRFYDAKSCLAEEQKIHPPKTIDDIWPHWDEGVPTNLRKTFYTSSFFKGRVYHRARQCYASLELKWQWPRA